MNIAVSGFIQCGIPMQLQEEFEALLENRPGLAALLRACYIRMGTETSNVLKDLNQLDQIKVMLADFW